MKGVMQIGYSKGDNITSFSHKCANGRKRKNNIVVLEKDGLVIEGNENLLQHATEYYAELFGPPVEYDVHMDPGIWENIVCVSETDNAFLCRPFSENEIKEALWQMESNKAAGPDKIPIEFYQSCWNFVKCDIAQLFDDFYHQRVDISRINYGINTLLPKIKEASKIQQCRPICLLNCLYKLITKTLTIRLERVADKLIHKTQIAFMKNRNIMSGIMCLHEILHETKRRKEVGLIVKLDFEKAYDKVNWRLLFACMKKRGFDDKWCSWIGTK